MQEETSNGTRTINPCFYHPNRGILCICRDDRQGICAECMVDHFNKGHKIVSVDEQVKIVNTILLNLESNLQEILNSKANILKKHEFHITYMNQ